MLCSLPNDVNWVRRVRARGMGNAGRPIDRLAWDDLGSPPGLRSAHGLLGGVITELYFEDYEIGSERRTFGRTLTEADIVTHAGQTGLRPPAGG